LQPLLEDKTKKADIYCFALKNNSFRFSFNVPSRLLQELGIPKMRSLEVLLI
tara:strand:- start:3369 stop:3524 length:156 start_codon:yes stop_codon:yes gene_type:complete